MAFAAEKPLFGKGMFSIDPNSTPEQLAARRALMAMIQPKYGSAKYVGEGLGQLATGVVSGLQNKRMRGIEGENTARASSIFAGLLGGAGASEIAGQQPMNILGANPNYGGPNDPEQIGADAMSAIGRGGYRDSLIGTESGGNFAAQNNEVGSGGARGHFGRVQFGHARLQDAMNAGVIPQGTTPEQFMASPEMQKATEDWHFADLEQQLSPLVGAVVNGKPLDMGALVAMGHLGGAGGARKFVETGGGYNPSDSFGTSLADYAAKHGGQGGPTQNTATPQIPPDQLIAALSNPWLSQEQRGMLQQVLDQQVAAGDPMKALELEKAQLELAQLKNPQADPMADIELEQARLDLEQDRAGGGADIPKTLTERKALAAEAGLIAGTPEYQGYIATGQLETPGGGTEYGLQMVLGRDANGDPVVMQLGKDGTAVQTKMPEGVTPDIGLLEAEKAAGTAEGKALGEDKALFDSLSSKMPGLEVVVSELEGLADKATYTQAGKVKNYIGAQFGFEPKEAAIARTDYIAKVDNQVLPMLRDTFGAAFTVKEGETLRATLGDPDKTPAEKKAVLRAFIEQAKRNLEGLAARTGEESSVAPEGESEADFIKRMGLAP